MFLPHAFVLFIHQYDRVFMQNDIGSKQAENKYAPISYCVLHDLILSGNLENVLCMIKYLIQVKINLIVRL